MFVITKEFMKKHCNGTAYQLRLFGLRYPLPKGWKKKLIGKQITIELKDLFILGKHKTTNIKTTSEIKEISYIKTNKGLIEAYSTKSKGPSKVKRDKFYKSAPWQQRRTQILIKYGNKCLCCGSGKQICVDHIKPLKYYWSLRLELNNLQILCNDCNLKKGSHDLTDYRAKPLINKNIALTAQLYKI